MDKDEEGEDQGGGRVVRVPPFWIEGGGSMQEDRAQDSPALS